MEPLNVVHNLHRGSFLVLGLIVCGFLGCSGGSGTSTPTTPIPDTTAPTAPTGLTATATGSAQISLAWAAATDNVGVAGYRVERCQGASCGSFAQIAAPTTTSFNDTGLTAGASYSYQVRASDAAGNLGAYSNIASAATPPPPDTTPPSAPTGLTATAASGTQINLAWTASTDNVGVTGYRVERCQGASCSSFAQIAAPTTTSFNDTSLTAGASYSYQVRASDAAGNLGAYSNIASATTFDTTAPTAPTGLSATPASSTQIDLAWTASTDNVGVTGYRVERCQGAGCTTFTQIAAPTATTFGNTGLAATTAYSYRVRAEDAAGNLGAYSSVASATTSSAFPLVVSGGGRYLQDQNGVPFPILGRTAWFITSLPEADYKAFIDDTVAKGYNAIEFHVVNHDPRGNNPPFGGNGALPFTTRLDTNPWNGSLVYTNPSLPFGEAPDFSTPNEAYWTHVDALLTYAESKGVLCFMFPAYVGFDGSNQGWMPEITVNKEAKMNAYGTFVANRYKARGNIVWMLGGDNGRFDNNQLPVEQALLAGMQSVPGQASVNFSAEWNSDTIYTDQTDPTLRAAGTLQGAYSFSGNVNTYARNGYAFAPAMPSFLLEGPYDQEGPDGNNFNGSATQPVRRFQWWGWLSGIGGYISGNGYVWPFNSSPPGSDWRSHLNTQGAQDMAQLNAFVRSIAWYNLVPSGLAGMKTLVTVGGSLPSLSDYVAAAATPDGALLVAYVPPDHMGSITIDMTAMSGPTQARWFNPASAAYTVIGTFANTGTSSFMPPGDNGTGFGDWVLLLEKQ